MVITLQIDPSPVPLDGVIKRCYQVRKLRDIYFKLIIHTEETCFVMFLLFKDRII